MREGFHVYIDDQDKLVCAIVEPERTHWLEPVGIADNLIEFIEYDFTNFWVVIEALYELPIFGWYLNPRAENYEETLDIHSEDFEDCKEYFRDIAEELEDTVGSVFHSLLL